MCQTDKVEVCYKQGWVGYLRLDGQERYLSVAESHSDGGQKPQSEWATLLYHMEARAKGPL